MSIYQGDTKISGNAMMVALPMFFATYQPRKLNNPSWLRADPYSWHSADLYVSAYAHLADNISGVTAETETIAGTTITFYKLSDEIKVVLPDQQANLDAIYNATGIGYYFVLDTTNRQFKLPRNTYGFTGLRTNAGDYVEESLPNVKTSGTVLQVWKDDAGSFTDGPIYKPQSTGYGLQANGGYTNTGPAYFNLNTANGTYKDNAPVQERATQAYLYFYVGNTVQNETSVDVAEMTEAINDKVDLSSSWGMPSNNYADLSAVSGQYYTASADGCFVLWGTNTNANSSSWVSLTIFHAQNDNTIGKQVSWTPQVSAGNELGATISCKKGDRCYVAFYNTTVTRLRFIYAQKTN